MYDNRLRLCRDRSGRIERLDNGAGRSSLLRYELGRIVAVDYQVRRAKGREPTCGLTGAKRCFRLRL